MKQPGAEMNAELSVNLLKKPFAAVSVGTVVENSVLVGIPFY